MEQARTELDRLGVTLLALSDRKLSTSPWDTVLSQKPGSGELMPNGTVVQVVLSGGSVTLPDFVGMTRKDALFMVQQMKLALLEIREIPVDDATQFDRVAAQFISDGTSNEYRPGDQVMQQTQVTLAIYVPSEAALAAAAEATEAAPQPTQEAAP